MRDCARVGDAARDLTTINQHGIIRWPFIRAEISCWHVIPLLCIWNSFLNIAALTLSAHSTAPLLESLVTNPLLVPTRLRVVVPNAMLLEAKSPTITTLVDEAAAIKT